MNCEEVRVDMRLMTPEELELGRKQAQQIHRLNHALPMTPEYAEALKDLFGENLGEGSYVAAPINGSALDRLKIGKNVYINTNCLAMARGGITIEDDVIIAANASLISNNHDPYDRQVLQAGPDSEGCLDRRWRNRPAGCIGRKVCDRSSVSSRNKRCSGLRSRCRVPGKSN